MWHHDLNRRNNPSNNVLRGTLNEGSNEHGKNLVELKSDTLPTTTTGSSTVNEERCNKFYNDVASFSFKLDHNAADLLNHKNSEVSSLCNNTEINADDKSNITSLTKQYTDERLFRRGSSSPFSQQQRDESCSVKSASSIRSRLQSLQQRRRRHETASIERLKDIHKVNSYDKWENKQPTDLPTLSPYPEPREKNRGGTYNPAYPGGIENDRSSNQMPSHGNSPGDDKSITGPSTAMKTRLMDLQSKIIKFEAQLQAESLQRRATEENRLSILSEGICALERTVNSEVRRRLEANKTIQAGFEAQLSTLEDHVDNALSDKAIQISGAVEALTKRIHEAESQVATLKTAQNETMERLKDDVTKAVRDLQSISEQIEDELKARRQREAAMFDRVSEIEKQIDNRLAIEKGIRVKDVNELKSTLEMIYHNHVALDEVFQQKLSAGFHDLKCTLEKETQAREQADDDIVQALNHYTVALQSALRIANAT